MRVGQNLLLLISGGILILWSFCSCQAEPIPKTCELTGRFALSSDTCSVDTDQFGPMCPVDWNLPIVVVRHDENFLYFVSQTAILNITIQSETCTGAIQKRQDTKEGDLFYTEILLQEGFLECAAKETIYFTARYLCDEQL